MDYEAKTWNPSDKLASAEFNRMETGIQEALATSPIGMIEAALSNQANTYDENLSYSIGDYCIYNNDLYRCIKEIESPGETWTDTHWEKTNFANELLNVLSQLNDSNKSVFDKIYPIGSIYISVKEDDPSELFGGTWERYAKGSVMVGVNEDDEDFETSNLSGGEKEVTLTESQMPSHTHTGPSHTHTGPSHTHSIPSLSGTAASAGSHTHSVNAREDNTTGGSSQRIGTSSTYTTTVSPLSSSGAHTHSVTTNSSTTGSSGTGNTGSSGTGNTGNAGSDESHTNLQPYVTCYIWQRTD